MKTGKKREFLNLITIAKAQQLIQNNFLWTPRIEIKPLNLCKNRILAKDVVSPIDVPPFDRSLMDGFAVRAEDTFDIEEIRPKTFRIIETLPAGKMSLKTLSEAFTCIEIATGAPIPYGANAVVMVEYTSKKTDEKVEIFRPVTFYENIDHSGSDVMYGETLLSAGEVLTPVRLGMLAALGMDKIKVLTKIKVGVLSSGDEICSPGDSLLPGCLYDSNSIILSGLIEEAGGYPIRLGICPDDPEIVKQTISQSIDDVDILIISGGTSAGEGDYSYRVITELGGMLLFHGVSMKPGKPLGAGVIDDKLILTLPGFPASAIFSFNQVIAPLLHRWTKTPLASRQKIQATIRQKIRSIPGRTQFKLVHLIKEGVNFYAYPVKSLSGSVSMLERADGYLSIPENVELLNPGDSVEITLLREKLLLADIIFIGSHDFVIDQLFREFRLTFPDYLVKQIYTGSTGGFSAMSLGACDIAGVHLFDAKTQQYNTPYIDKWDLNEKVIVLRGYKRNQGLYVPKGNPRKITRLEDLLRDDITFLNRNEGSGTRVLLDTLLTNLCQQRTKSIHELQQEIRGYSATAYSHSATASAVARKKVDVSIGIEIYAKSLEIDFIPLVEEEYDLLINKRSLEKPGVKKLIELFSSEDFRQKLEYPISWISNC